MAEAEYISKEAALACFSDWIDRYGHEHTADEMVEYQRIEDLPAADVRPVVLCRDCKHFNPYPGDCTDGGIEGVYKRHNSIGVLVMDEDFCSDAERI